MQHAATAAMAELRRDGLAIGRGMNRSPMNMGSASYTSPQYALFTLKILVEFLRTSNF